MNKREHTPEPWIASRMKLEGDGIHMSIGDANGNLIAQVYKRPERAVSDANTRLIESCPELFAACKMMVDAVNQKDMDPLIVFASIEKARAVIAKVESK